MKFLELDKAYLQKPTTNIVINVKKIEAFPLRSGMRLWCPLSPLLFNTVLEVLASIVKQEKELKAVWMGKEEVKLLLFTCDNSCLYRKSKRTGRKLLKLVSDYWKDAIWIYKSQSLSYKPAMNRGIWN